MLTLLNPHRHKSPTYLTPTVVDSDLVTGTGNGSLEPTLAGAASGNVILLFCAYGGSPTQTFTPPEGFSLLASVGGNASGSDDVTLALFIKTAEGGETALPCSTGGSSTNGFAAAAIELGNVNGLSPVADSDTGSGNGHSVTVSFTIPVMVIAARAIQFSSVGSGYSISSGTADVVGDAQADVSGQDVSFRVYSTERDPSVDADTLTFTSGSSTRGLAGIAVAIKAAVEL